MNITGQIDVSVSARAYLGTSEILTTLMLNYIAGFIITYLIFNSDSSWRDLSTAFARSYLIGKVLPARGNWPRGAHWRGSGASRVAPRGHVARVSKRTIFSSDRLPGCRDLVADALGIQRRVIAGMPSFFVIGEPRDDFFDALAGVHAVTWTSSCEFVALQPVTVAVTACPDIEIPGFSRGALSVEVEGASNQVHRVGLGRCPCRRAPRPDTPRADARCVACMLRSSHSLAVPD